MAVFTTSNPDYKVEDFETSLSTNLNEAELNNLIKSLLVDASIVAEEHSNNLQFEFLIEGTLLRGKLKSHIMRYDIKCEKSLNIEYVLAF